MLPRYNVVLKEFAFVGEIHGEKTVVTVLAESVAAAKLKLPRELRNPKILTEGAKIRGE